MIAIYANDKLVFVYNSDNEGDALDIYLDVYDLELAKSLEDGEATLVDGTVVSLLFCEDYVVVN